MNSFRNLLKSPEVILQEGVGMSRLVDNIYKGQKSFISIAFAIGIAIALLVVFVIIYFVSGNNSGLMTIAISGVILTTTVILFGILAALLSMGTYIAHLVLALHEKENNIAETMEEISILLLIVKHIKDSAPNALENVLEREDITRKLEEHPALEERFLTDINYRVLYT